MGQAKNRGTREERILQAHERQRQLDVEEAVRRRHYAEREALGRQQREEERQHNQAQLVLGRDIGAQPSEMVLLVHDADGNARELVRQADGSAKPIATPLETLVESPRPVRRGRSLSMVQTALIAALIGGMGSSFAAHPMSDKERKK